MAHYATDRICIWIAIIVANDYNVCICNNNLAKGMNVMQQYREQ